MFNVNGKLHSSVVRLAPTSAGSVVAARPEFHQAGGGAIPTPALHDLLIRPVSFKAAKALIVRHHYLHSLPGGTCLAFGVFHSARLVGAMTFGVGPKLAHRLVQDAQPEDCMTLTRLWLSDDLPSNSESRVLGIAVRALRRHGIVKFLVSYADPVAGHLGTINQATGWLYTGLNDATPTYDLGDGVQRHSRTLSSAFGTHSVSHFRNLGIPIQVIPGVAKHRYLQFLDDSWRDRLAMAALPYPKSGATR